MKIKRSSFLVGAIGLTIASIVTLLGPKPANAYTAETAMFCFKLSIVMLVIWNCTEENE